jgi:hypothetical protein
MGKYKNIKREEQLKSLVFNDYFKYKSVSFTPDLNNIDFVVADSKSRGKEQGGAEKHYVWMETKKDIQKNIFIIIAYEKTYTV